MDIIEYQKSGKEKINFKVANKEYNYKEYLINSLNPQTGFGFCHMKLIRKDIIDTIKFNEKLSVGEDALFNIEISNHIKCAYKIKENLYNYRIHRNSIVRKYDSDYAKKYLEMVKICKKVIIDNCENEPEIIQNYYNFTMYHILLIAVNFCYNPQNKSKNKRKLLKEICSYEEFKEAIKKCNYKNVSITRKITIFTLKYKLYFLTELICRYRQIQNRGLRNG